ncbi:MAG: GNAT family N-acetyltransferase [Chitinophagales bacterium]|nr:GNAT family N-acetyltransferase [Chitinophagales bacterium]
MKTRLREWRIEDAGLLTKYANNKKIADNMRDTFPNPYTLGDAMFWITANESKIPQYTFAIEVDDGLAGSCGVHPKEDVYSCSAEVGYWLAEPFWGKGVATEAVRLLLDQTIPQLTHIYRLYAEVFEHNKASMRVLEKNGFYLESIRKKAVIKNGKVMDDYVWVKLLK